MIPKIIFRRSWIYEQKLAPLRDPNFKLPDDVDVNRNIKNLEKKWKVIGPKILSELSKITDLKWHQKETVCYVVAGIIPFSDPLTIHTSKNVLRMVHMLTHEMIHRLLSEEENRRLLTQCWNDLFKKYKRGNYTTQVHIIVHAIHEQIFRKFFGEKALAAEISWVRSAPYIKSWKIVQESGYKNIIKDFFKRLK